MPAYYVFRLVDAAWTGIHDWDFDPPIPFSRAVSSTSPNPTVPPSLSPTLDRSCPGQGLGWCDCPPDPEEIITSEEV